MTSFSALLDKLANIFGMAAVACLVFLMVGTSLDVTVRAITGRPISGVFEMAETSMVLLVFLGLGWTKMDNAHIRVTLLIERLPHKARLTLEAISWALAALMLLMLAIPASQDAVHSFSIREFRWGYIQFPIWWAKIILALGLWAGFLQMALQPLRIIVTRKLPEEPALADPGSAH